jgi:hypothetical protein
MGEGESYIYNTIDFDFFAKIGNHPKLAPAQALHLIDIMAKIYLNDTAYANCAAAPFMNIATRYIRHNDVFDFLIKFMTMTFSMLPALEK